MTLAQLYAKLMSRATRHQNGCLTVRAPETKRRYLSVLFDGRKTNAHRAVYEFRHGPIADDLEVCHRCDNGFCLEDSHHFLGTHWENMQDRNRKGHVRKPRQSLLKAGVYQINRVTGSVTRVSPTRPWRGKSERRQVIRQRRLEAA